MNDDVNILAAGGARYVAGPSEMGGWGRGAIVHPQIYADLEAKPSHSKGL